MPRDQRQDPADDRVRIEHMLEGARLAARFVSGRKREDLDTDPMLERALINVIQQIGEAAARTSDMGRARVPGVPWGQIVAVRHILVHVYWGVDRDRLWSTAVDDVPVLLRAIEKATECWPLPPEQ